MFLHRIHLDPRCGEVRRDLADPYQLHSTLCRAFSESDRKCPEGQFLWRLEPETDPIGCPRILVQGRKIADWTGIGVKDWLAEADPTIDLRDRLKLNSLKVGQRFRFRLRANPCVTRNAKRLGLMRPDEQQSWLKRKGEQHGFSLPKLASFDFTESAYEHVDVRIYQSQMLRGKQHHGNGIRIYSVLYDGVLTVTDPEKFRDTLQTGIGHGKVMGLGLLSVVPVV
jgi:CRISPR system Cascade subunit CasE